MILKATTVCYAASQKLSGFLETLARFRLDPSLFAELNQIVGEDDYFPLGSVPRQCCDERLLGSASAEGNCEYLCGRMDSILAPPPAGQCLRLGLGDLDASVLRSQARPVTQLASLDVYRQNYDGIYYHSRHSHDLENWALFEPFRIRGSVSHPIASDDPAFLEALRILGLKFAA